MNYNESMEYMEVIKKYGNSNPWDYLIDLFDYLPLVSLIEGKIYFVFMED